jgi:hypothetical protein
MSFPKPLPADVYDWTPCPRCNREPRCIRTRVRIWLVCKHCRIRWPAPTDCWSADWTPMPDDLMSEADRYGVPMAWSDAEAFAYRKKMLAEFEDVGGNV